MTSRIDFDSLEGFVWDNANIEKNWRKHKVDFKECEEIFVNNPLIVFDDKKHSQKEKRYGALGKTTSGRKLAIFFTIRKNKIRIISARDMGKKDRLIYKINEEKILKKRGDKYD